ncbi:MAG: TetR/AcrR family transcriptional regulator [Saprospiraceae bacterium]
MKTRDRIIQTAIDLFNERGMYKTSVRDISQILAISPGNLSYHFSRKEDLLTAILDQYRQQNDQAYTGYFDGPPGLARYLDLVAHLLRNAYAYRGVFLGLDELRSVLGTEYDYGAVEQKRRAFLEIILNDLEMVGDLQFVQVGKDFIIDFLAFFQRCWIMEAMISYPHLGESDLIHRYMGFLARQFMSISTEQGQTDLAIWL